MSRWFRLASASALVGLFLISEGWAATGLLELYLRAREYDPVFVPARLDREIAEQTLNESRYGYLPVVNATIEASQTDQKILESPTLTPSTPDTNGDGIPDAVVFPSDHLSFAGTRLTLSLTQPIYRADALRRIPQAQAEVRRAQALYLAAEQDLMVRLAQAVFTALSSQDGLEFATAERAAIERQLEQSEERLGSGLGTITDVHDARARFADAQAREIEAQNALADALQVVAGITGEVPDDLRPLGESIPLVEPERPEIDAWVRTALFQNLTVQARQEQVQVAEHEIKVQKAARLPNLSLVASYRDYDSAATAVGDTFREGTTATRTGDVLLQLGIPIFDGRVSHARTQRAVLQHQVAVQQLETERRSVERETRAAFMGVVSGIERVQALNQAVFSQERALESKDEAFRAGLDTGLSVLDTRRDLFMARRDFSEARYVFLLNTLRLKRATGTLGLQDLRQIDAYFEER